MLGVVWWENASPGVYGCPQLLCPRHREATALNALGDWHAVSGHTAALHAPPWAEQESTKGWKAGELRLRS